MKVQSTISAKISHFLLKPCESLLGGIEAVTAAFDVPVFGMTSSTITLDVVFRCPHTLGKVL